MTRCKFGFLRPVSTVASLKPIEESLKTWKKIYELERNAQETRINDYI